MRRPSMTLAVVLAGASLTWGCTGGDDVEVLTDDGSLDGAAALAEGNGYGLAASAMGGMTPEGLGLQVEYFEPLRKGDWTAPDGCWFPTRVTVGGGLRSPGFSGPRSDDDRSVGDGVLVGSLESAVARTPAGVEIDQGTVTTLDGTEEPTTILGPDPATAVPVTVVVAAVFGHDQVAELSTQDPDADPDRRLDTTPLDGWSLLSVVLDRPTTAAGTTTVRLRRVLEDGSERSEELSVDLGRRDLELRTPGWEFDLGGVGADCIPPDEPTTNTAPDPESDLFGSPIGNAPQLPPAGEQPADPTAASNEALAALRKVYDLTDIYAESKKDVVENPDDYLVMREQLLANDVVAPYMSRLDPEFRNSVFVSPTEVHVLYRVGPGYQWEIGRVLLIDGRWRVAAGTVCRDLSAAGYTCPNATKDPPPGPLG